MFLYQRHHEYADLTDELDEADMMTWCTTLGIDDYLDSVEALSCTAGSDRVVHALHLEHDVARHA